MTRYRRLAFDVPCSDLVARVINCVLIQGRKLGFRGFVINAIVRDNPQTKGTSEAIVLGLYFVWGTVKDWLFWSLF